MGDSMEVGTADVDCTLSLGTAIKQDGADIPGGLSRTQPTSFQLKSSCSPTTLGTRFNYLGDFSGCCTRELFAQDPRPIACTSTGAATFSFPWRDRVKASSSNAAENVSCNSPGGSSREGMFVHTGGAFSDARESKANPSPADTVRKEVVRSVPRRSSIFVVPQLRVPEKKYIGVPTRSVVPPPTRMPPSLVRDDASLILQKSSDLDEDGKTQSVGRLCSRCGTMKTPLWRNGPAGPKSLCNACGIRFKKASKRNSSSESSSEVLDSMSSTPPSVRKCTSKRKLTCSVIVSKEPSESETERKAGSEFATMSRKRKKMSPAECSGHVGGESSRSSGTSGLTWQAHPSAAACIIPQRSTCLVAPAPDLPVRDVVPRSETWFSGSNMSGITGRRAFAQDEEEGARLLMALSCGLVSA